MDFGRDKKDFRRLNAIHLLLIGASYNIVLRNNRVCERMLRLWISRFNSQGIDGLIYRPRPGRPRALDALRLKSEILPLVDDPSMAGETHWTRVKLCGWLREEKQIVLSYRTLVRYLHEHEYVRKVPRPMPEPSNREAWEDQRETFAAELLELLEDSACEVFLAIRPALKAIQDRCRNGSNEARVPSSPIRAATSGRTSSARSILLADNW